MKKIVLLSFFISVCFYVSSQSTEYSQWTTYLNNVSVVDMADAGDYLWIITTDQVIKFEKLSGVATHFTLEDMGLESTYSLGTIECDKNGNPYIGSDWGRVLKLINNEWTELSPGNLGDESFFNSKFEVVGLKIIHRDTLWAAVRDGLLIKFAGDNVTIYDESNSQINGFISAFATDKDGNIWLGTYFGIKSHFDALLKFNGQNWSVFNYYKSSNIPYLFTDMIINNHGKLWMGGFEGITSLGTKLISFDGTNWEFLDIPELGFFASDFAIEYDTVLWIGSSGDHYGVVRYDNTNWSFYSMDNSGIPSNNVSCIVNDSNSILWIGTDNGLAAYDKSDIIAAYKFTSGLDVEFFPNPVHNKLNVTTPSDVNHATIKIYSLQCKLLKSEQLTLNRSQIDVSRLSDGIYLVEVNTKQKNWIGKFVKL